MPDMAFTIPNLPPPGRKACADHRAWNVEAEREVRKILADAIKRSGKTRAQVAHEMEILLDRDISKSVLDDFIRSPKAGRIVRFPAAWVPAFCQAVGNDSLQRHLLSEALRSALELGERVHEMGKLAIEVQDGIARLSAPAQHNKGKGRHVRKA